jgi:proteasome alpha subunit
MRTSPEYGAEANDLLIVPETETVPAYSPYDWNDSIQQRNEYIEDRLKAGSPVVAVTYDAGILMLSVRQTQRKVYEVYDRLMFSAIGNHSDIEQVRVAAIDVAHAEGFSRSPDDVSVQRLVSFRISPAIKKVYSDPFAQPVVFRGIFAELGKTPERDQIVTLSYDGEFATEPGTAVVAGTAYAEDRMKEHLKSELSSGPAALDQALRAALYAWGIGMEHVEAEDKAETEDAERSESKAEVSRFISDHLGKNWVVEAGILERNTSRENKFRLVTDRELAGILADYR